MKNHHLIVFCIWVLLLSSCTSEMNEVSINLHIDRPIKSRSGLISDSLSTFIFYHKHANDTVTFSNVMVTRQDLGLSDSLVVPFANGNEYRNMFGMYDVDNRKIDYDKNATNVLQSELLDRLNNGSYINIPNNLEVNQLVISQTFEDGYNFFRDVKKAKDRIIKVVDSTRFAIMDFEVYFERPRINDILEVPVEESTIDTPRSQEPATDVKTNSSSQERAIVVSTPREAVYNVNLASQNWSNKVTWKRIPNADKVVISVREKNGNPKAYNKNFEAFAGGEVFTIPPGRGIDATFLYNIELKAFDKDGNEMKLLNNRISEVNIDCNN